MSPIHLIERLRMMRWRLNWAVDFDIAPNFGYVGLQVFKVFFFLFSIMITFLVIIVFDASPPPASTVTTAAGPRRTTATRCVHLQRCLLGWQRHVRRPPPPHPVAALPPALPFPLSVGLGPARKTGQQAVPDKYHLSRYIKSCTREQALKSL